MNTKNTESCGSESVTAKEVTCPYCLEKYGRGVSESDKAPLLRCYECDMQFKSEKKIETTFITSKTEQPINYKEITLHVPDGVRFGEVVKKVCSVWAVELMGISGFQNGIYREFDEKKILKKDFQNDQ